MNHTIWMQKALDLAKHAQSIGEVPVGAVLVNAQQEMIGCGWNQVQHTHDPTAHAEVVAIRNAAVALSNYRLPNTTLYVTLEPCCMCAAAMVQARIGRLVFATRDWSQGAAGSVFNLLKGYPLNHQVQIDEAVLQPESARLLRDFFHSKR